MNSSSNQVETIIDVTLTGRNRKTAFFRYILALPVAIYVGVLSVSLFVPTLLALVFRGIYPSYALNFTHSLIELHNRLAAYVFLLTDDYPSIERNPKFALLFPDVEGGKRLNRWLPLVKWFLAIPLYIVGFVYVLLTYATTIVAWFSVTLTGTYPPWGVNVVVGAIKYWNRVYGYAFALVTDEYPSFKL